MFLTPISYGAIIQCNFSTRNAMPTISLPRYIRLIQRSPPALLYRCSKDSLVQYKNEISLKALGCLPLLYPFGAWLRTFTFTLDTRAMKSRGRTDFSGVTFFNRSVPSRRRIKDYNPLTSSNTARDART